MSMQLQYDVVVVGAGLVGASLAASVAKACPQLSIAVVEASAVSPAILADAQAAPFDPRVVALTDTSQALLDKFGAWPAVVAQRYCAYREMSVWDGEGSGSIHFDCRDQRREHLGCIVENSVALAAVHQTLLEFDNVDVLRPLALQRFVRIEQTDTIELHFETGESLQASLLVAADGANSAIREQAGFAMREWDYGHKAIVTTVRCERPHQFTAWQRFMATGPLALLPLTKPSSTNGKDADNHYCSIVWSCEEPLATELMALSDAEFCARLGQAFEYLLGTIDSVDKRYAITLRQRHAKQYTQKNLVLVGDAAHTIHPLAGQGVNLGLLDARVLTEEITRAVQRGVPLSDASVLGRYQRRRLGDNLLMMAAMEGFKRLFGSRNLSLQWLRNEGMRRVASFNLLKKWIVKNALK